MHAYVNKNGIVTIGASVLMSPTIMNAIVTVATTPTKCNRKENQEIIQMFSSSYIYIALKNWNLFSYS